VFCRKEMNYIRMYTAQGGKRNNVVGKKVTCATAIPSSVAQTNKDGGRGGGERQHEIQSGSKTTHDLGFLGHQVMTSKREEPTRQPVISIEES